MNKREPSISRRSVLKQLAIVPAAAAGIAASLSAPADAAKATQKAVKYQNTPKGNQRCAGCRFFQANKRDPKKNGTCQIVQGSISPNGWCVAFAAAAAKPKAKAKAK